MATEERKAFLLRIDPSLWGELEAWAADELRSVNAQIEFVLRRMLAEAGRLPGAAPKAERRREGKER